MPRCRTCELDLPIENFYINSDRNRPSTYCKECEKQQHRDRTAESKREANLRANYGITQNGYEKILLSQNGKCAICERTDTGSSRVKYFFVDHNHDTEVIRGLLCHTCNMGLGSFADSKELLRLAIKYLEKYEEPSI